MAPRLELFGHGFEQLEKMERPIQNLECNTLQKAVSSCVRSLVLKSSLETRPRSKPFFCKAGGGWILLFGCEVGWRGGGKGGKISMSDFGKRRGESIFLFAKKEFKPEGRGRGRGGAHDYYFFFLQGRGGGWILLFGCEVGWRGGGKGGED